MWIEKHRDVFRIRETVGGQKVTLSSGYATKTAAKDAMAIHKAEALQGTALVPRGGEKTVGDFCEEWWADVGATYTRVRSNESIYGVMERYIIRLIGHVKLRELDDHPDIVQRWVNDLQAGRTKPKRGKPRALAPKTVRNVHGLLHQLMDVAKRKKLIRANPCEVTRLPEEVEGEMWFLTPAEADRLLAATPEHWKPMVLFLLATGCRFSEARGLRAKNLDVLGRKVRILKKIVEDNHGRFHEEDPKSKRGRRTLSFPTRVAEALIPLAMLDDDRERRIFRALRGGHIRYKDFYYKVWVPTCEKAGLVGLRVHDLRHTHVAWLIAGDVQLPAISRRLGHKNTHVTDVVYGHLMEQVNDRLVEALTEAMEVIDMGEARGEIRGESTPHKPRRSPVKTGRVPVHRRTTVRHFG